MSFSIRKYMYLSHASYETCLASVSKNGLALQYVPVEYRDDAMCTAAIANDYRAFTWANESNIQAFIDSVCKSDAEGLREMILSEDVKRRLILVRPFIVMYLSDLSDELIRYAVDLNPDVLHVVKPTPELIKIAESKYNYDSSVSESDKLAILKSKPYLMSLLKPSEETIWELIHDGLRKPVDFLLYNRNPIQWLVNPTQEMIMHITKNSNNFFQYFEQSDEICQIAVQRSSDNIQYCKTQTEELCWQALKQQAYTIRYIKHPTPSMVAYAMTILGDLSYVSLEYRTETACKIAYAKDKNNIHLFPCIYRSHSLCVETLPYNGYAIKYIENPSIEDIRVAIKADPCSIQFVECDMSLYEMAVSLDGRALAYVEEQSPAICKLAVSNDGTAIRYVKDQTLELCLIAAKQNPKAMEYIDFTKIDIAECWKVVRKDAKPFLLSEAHLMSPDLSKLFNHRSAESETKYRMKACE